MQCIACSSEHFMVPRKWQKVLPVGHNALQSNLGWVNVGFLIFRHKKSSKTCSKQADGILKNPKNPMLKNLVSFQIMQNQSQFKTRNATEMHVLGPQRTELHNHVTNFWKICLRLNNCK